MIPIKLTTSLLYLLYLEDLTITITRKGVVWTDVARKRGVVLRI